MYEFTLFLIIYLSFISIYFFVRYKLFYKRASTDWLTEILIITLLPGCGLIMMWILLLGGHRKSELIVQEHFKELVPKIIEAIPTSYNAEVNQNHDIIPIEEALLISNLKTRRRLLLDLLKKDFNHYISLLKVAINNEDTETSHYAAAAITEVKRKLLLSLQSSSSLYEMKKDDIHFLYQYAKQIQQFLNSGFLDSGTILYYKEIYIQILTDIVRLKQGNPDIYSELIRTVMELRQYGNAEYFCNHFIQLFPDSEQAYLLKLKVLYEQKQYKELRNILDYLKTAPFPLSNTTHNLIHFWSEGV